MTRLDAAIGTLASSILRDAASSVHRPHFDECGDDCGVGHFVRVACEACKSLAAMAAQCLHHLLRSNGDTSMNAFTMTSPPVKSNNEAYITVKHRLAK
ncbi:hypothetical protein Cni_G14325 [Canna indica]|uniref:Uncharacterized protein n=1 Tax=Canna indica TaxID=4628 RepID=A0AAQ3QDJ7_9LILI|nr:hypothetical protein Cni_G14325 [Canna indica]